MPLLSPGNNFGGFVQQSGSMSKGGEKHAQAPHPEARLGEIPLGIQDSDIEGGSTSEPPSTFTGYLYRPYIDLTPEAPEGNSQTKGLLLAIDAVEHDRERARIHGLYPNARYEILRRAQALEYDIDDPVELPMHLRSPQWQMLCDQLYDIPAPVNVLWLLHRLYMHDAVIAYAGSLRRREDSDITFMRGQAILALSGNPEVLETLANWPDALGSWGAIEATYLLAAQAAKVQGNADLTNHWAIEHFHHIKVSGVGGHDYAKLMSRYFRVAAFVPQLRKDNDGMVRVLDQAEHWLGEMTQETEDQQTECQTLGFALWETRTKEALMLGDFDLAKERAAKAFMCASLRPAAHLLNGQVLVELEDYEEAAAYYSTAAYLGPSENQDSAVAYFMAGQCWEMLGDLHRARDLYLDALREDPLDDSALEQIVIVAAKLGNAELVKWASARLASVGDNSKPETKPYQAYEGKLG